MFPRREETIGRPETHEYSAQFYRWSTLAVYLLAAILRIVLIREGGQFGQIDEARYLVSRDAARLISEGKWKEGIALPLAGGDHIGFKAIGVIPALIERVSGQNDQLPAYFFGSFSLLNIILIGGIARRIEGTESARFWTTLVSAGAGSWFYFARHLLPYDASISFMLLSLFVGFSTKPGPQRAWLSGLWAGVGFVVYYGYWMLAGVVLAIPVIWRAVPVTRSNIRVALKWSALAALGFLCAVALPILVDSVLGAGRLVSGARRLSGTITAGDFRGFSVPLEYLWYADRLLFVMAIAAAVATIINLLIEKKQPSAARYYLSREVAEALFVLGIVAIWLGFVLTGNLLHKFVIHDRLVRQLTPFLFLVLGIGLAKGICRLGWWRRAIALSVLAIGANAIWAFAIPLTLEFPRDFKARGDVILRDLEKIPHPGTYYRYVNVVHYFREPETLKVEPLQTLLARRHPHQYIPYLYEAHTPEQRALRLQVDHRMRLVKMPVRPTERITGEPYGQVKMEAVFPENRGGYTEPLLSVGPRGSGDVFFVRYITATRITLGVECINVTIFESDPFDILPGKRYALTMFSGSLLPSDKTNLSYDLKPEQLRALRTWIEIDFDGHPVLLRNAPANPCPPDDVYAGVNIVGTDSSDSQFSGEISNVIRGGAPTPQVQASPGGWGQVEITLTMPAVADGGAEPLLVVGEVGKAVFVYTRLLPGKMIKVGVEVWGIGAWESDPVPSRFPKEDIFTCSLPALFPGAEDPLWGSISPELRNRLAKTVAVACNGRTTLSRSIPSIRIDSQSLVIGQNPLGGSVVRSRFSGKIGSVRRLPIEGPNTLVP